MLYFLRRLYDHSFKLYVFNEIIEQAPYSDTPEKAQSIVHSAFYLEWMDRPNTSDAAKGA